MWKAAGRCHSNLCPSLLRSTWRAYGNRRVVIAEELSPGRCLFLGAHKDHHVDVPVRSQQSFDACYDVHLHLLNKSRDRCTITRVTN
jgi:hypothetical protein